MFLIKICGLTSVDDALTVAEAGADAIGLNFYAKSPRYVPPEEARRIADAVRGRLLCMGVMVNPSEEEALSLASQVGLDVVQLHGDEPAALAARLSRSVAVVKAFRVSSQGLRPVLDYLEEFRRAGGVLRPILFDAYRPGQFGGAGTVADWIAIKDYPSESWHPPFVLAGGLTPDNVAAAIQTLRPAGVDAASGVEQSPGRKDPILVARFVREAREGFTAAGMPGGVTS
jgi:phosphoribosylanthranilate isomerase